MPLTLRNVVTRFLDWGEKALAPSTVDAYRHQLEKFLRAAKNKQVRHLKPSHLSAWAKTWHEAQAVIRAFNWAVNEERIIRKNPFLPCRMPPRGARRRIITPAQTVRFLRSAGVAGRQFLLALRETFARPQEIRLAQWEDLQTEDMSDNLDEALSAGRAVLVLHEFKDCDRRIDSTRARVLLISARLGRLLLRLGRARPGRRGFIFLNERNEPWTNNAVRCLMRRLRRRLKLVCDHRGENIVAYTFRHSLATLAASKGVTDRTLADLLGHVETRTTSRYLHLQVAHLRSAMKKARANNT